jgi:Na+/alanine symporter
MESVAAILSAAFAGAGVIGGFALYVIRGELKSEVTRVDGRINAHEAGCSQRQAKLDERHASIQGRLEAIDHRSERMDAKLDRLLEGER